MVGGSESGHGRAGRVRPPRPGMSAKAGILVLAVTVIVVGVAGYLVISHTVDSSTNSHTVDSCQPSAVPPCAGQSPSSAAEPAVAGIHGTGAE
jgi:hypothetical protein